MYSWLTVLWFFWDGIGKNVTFVRRMAFVSSFEGARMVGRGWRKATFDPSRDGEKKEDDERRGGIWMRVASFSFDHLQRVARSFVRPSRQYIMITRSTHRILNGKWRAKVTQRKLNLCLVPRVGEGDDQDDGGSKRCIQGKGCEASSHKLAPRVIRTNYLSEQNSREIHAKQMRRTNWDSKLMLSKWLSGRTRDSRPPCLLLSRLPITNCSSGDCNQAFFQADYLVIWFDAFSRRMSEGGSESDSSRYLAAASAFLDPRMQKVIWFFK